MNERLKEIAKEAMVHMEWPFAERRLEDFAYRIVKECVEVNRQHNFFERGWMAMYQHFGMDASEIFEKKDEVSNTSTS